MKRIFRGIPALVLTMIFLVALIPLNASADWTKESTGYCDNPKYWGTNWKSWSQKNAPASSSLNKYGCWVVAMAQLIMESKSAPSGFNPGVYLKWERQNGYINKNNFNQSNKNGSGYAPVAYAKAQGKKLSVARSTNRTEAQLLSLLKSNYLIVKVLSGGSGAHYVYVAREESLRDGKIYFRDLGKSNIRFGYKPSWDKDKRAYKAHEVWAYPVATTDDNGKAQTELVAIPDGEYTIRNDSFYMNASKDSNGGNVNTSTNSSGDARVWQISKSSKGVNSHKIASKSSATGRVLNVYSEKISAAGMNVTLYSVTGDPNQLWTIEQKDSAYIIHPSDNVGVALTLQSDGDVKLAASKGTANQLWYIESTDKKEIVVPEIEPETDPETDIEGDEETIDIPDEIDDSDDDDDFVDEVAPVTIDIPGEAGGKLTAYATSLGVKFNWTPDSSQFGYRIYRSETSGEAGISISDFPLKGGSYIDVNIKTDVTYYYSICRVEEEASFDRNTLTLIPEKLGNRSSEMEIYSYLILDPIIPDDEEIVKNFILMQLGKPTMVLNEDILDIDPGRITAPRIENGRTLVPIRAIIEAMGGIVEWNAESPRLVKLLSTEAAATTFDIEMTIGSTDIIVDGAEQFMDVAPVVINDRTMLPVRFVAENVGAEIAWLGSTQEIVIVFYTVVSSERQS